MERSGPLKILCCCDVIAFQSGWHGPTFTATSYPFSNYTLEWVINNWILVLKITTMVSAIIINDSYKDLDEKNE